MKFLILPFILALVSLQIACNNKSNTSKESKNIEWIDFSELEAKQAEQKKKVIVDAYTVWCGWCKKMDKHTFEHPEIAAYINEKFYAVKFNAETKTPINYKGTLYSFVESGKRGYNQLAKTLLKGRLSYPTISFLDEELNLINAFPGYKDAPIFDGLLHYIIDEKYVNREPLQQYLDNFNSPIQSIAASVKKSPPIDNRAKKMAAPKKRLPVATPTVVNPKSKKPAPKLKIQPNVKKEINPDFKVKRVN